MKYLIDRKELDKKAGRYEPNIFIKKVTEGVYLVILDFVDQLDIFVTEGNNNKESVVFEDDNDFALEFKMFKKGIFIGSMIRRTYHGTFYTNKVWAK